MNKTVDPKAIDNMLVELSMELGRVRRLRTAMVKTEQTGAKLDRATAKGYALDEALTALEGLHTAYGWTRYIVVPDGHVHFEGCSTLRHDTLRSFLPDESGNTVTEMIAKYTTLMCTVCFPQAPVDPAYREAERKSEAQKQEARAAKDAAKAEKDALTPRGDDGEPLKVGMDTPKTERGARNALASRCWDMDWYSRDGKLHPDHDKWAVESIRLARSIARLEGAADVDGRSREIYAQAQAKAAKKVDADLRKWARENGQGR